MLVFTWDENNYMHFFQPHSTPLVDESTLCLPKMTFTDIVIIDPTGANLFPQSFTIQGFVAFDVV
jgi:hypothetical protein